MYTCFFTYQNALPETCGFPIFGKIHLIWLACIKVNPFVKTNIFYF